MIKDKYPIISLALIILMFVCVGMTIKGCTNDTTTKPFTAVMHNGMNVGTIECDSFKMISKTQAITYNNGVAMPIVADEIRINSNN